MSFNRGKYIMEDNNLLLIFSQVYEQTSLKDDNDAIFLEKKYPTEISQEEIEAKRERTPQKSFGLRKRILAKLQQEYMPNCQNKKLKEEYDFLGHVLSDKQRLNFIEERVIDKHLRSVARDLVRKRVSN